MSKYEKMSREFTRQFLELYKSYPSLWKVKSAEYKDLRKKNQSYELLAQKLREIEGTATVETVKKKINSLRTVYRKELSKVNQSLRSGASKDEVYRPNLWYFDLINDFLSDQEIPEKSRRKLNNNDSQQKLKNKNTAKEDIPQDSSQHELATTVYASPGTSASISNTNSRIPTSVSHSSNKRKADEETSNTPKLLLIGNKIESNKNQDEFSDFGKHVANKLRNLDTMQSKIAQKLINDVLFEGDMGCLNRNFRVCDENPANFTNLNQKFVSVESTPTTAMFSQLANSDS